MLKKIESVLISVYDKSGLDDLLALFDRHGTKIYSTGGTWQHLEEKGLNPVKVEDITGFPSILDGRVKTLHPKVFGGILARREESHLEQTEAMDIPLIDMVIVDLYPFEKTIAGTTDENEIIEKIDIGGISLIRAAAKNHKDVLVVPSKDYYQKVADILDKNQMQTDEETRKEFAKYAFATSMHYDTIIYKYFSQEDFPVITKDIQSPRHLRYGENPHQKGTFFGNPDDIFEKLNGKELSYNNLVDIDAALNVINEFDGDTPTFAILKHTNTCGIASAPTISVAWDKALEGDPQSAFGGVLISNRSIDLETAEKINTIFYEVLIAPDFDPAALDLLKKKKKRIILKLKKNISPGKVFKSILNGVISQDADGKTENKNDLKTVTAKAPAEAQLDDLVFANKVVKHLKSNAIALVKNRQLVGMGCGQTSRVDACRQAIEKAIRYGLDLNGAVMASDAFFPFPDSIELAHKAGIKAIVQPGGSIKDNLSIEYCDNNDLAMVFTGTRHFKH